MSSNPDAFISLRLKAYAFVRTHGKDRERLSEYCRDTMEAWRNGEGSMSDLSSAEAQQIVREVTEWVIARYNIPRPQTKWSREARATAQLLAPGMLEAAEEVFGRGSVRRAARLTDQSKSTMARHLRAQGVAPRRAKKIEKLPAVQKRLLAILEATFPYDGAGILRTDALTTALWSSSGLSDDTPPSRSTKSTRRKKLRELLGKLSDAGLGFHLVPIEDVVAVRRGRRFRDQKEMLIWIEDEQNLRGFRRVLLPVAIRAGVGLWDDPWVEDLMAVLKLGIRPYIDRMEDLQPLLHLARPLLDERALVPWLHRALNAYFNEFENHLLKLAEKIVEPAVQAAARKIALAVINLPRYAASRDPDQFFDAADQQVGFMNRVRHLPDTYSRFGFIRAQFFVAGADEGKELSEILADCAAASKAEAEGQWQPPDAAVLAQYSPENEPPF